MIPEVWSLDGLSFVCIPKCATSSLIPTLQSKGFRRGTPYGLRGRRVAVTRHPLGRWVSGVAQFYNRADRDLNHVVFGQTPSVFVESVLRGVDEDVFVLDNHTVSQSEHLSLTPNCELWKIEHFDDMTVELFGHTFDRVEPDTSDEVKRLLKEELQDCHVDAIMSFYRDDLALYEGAK